MPQPPPPSPFFAPASTPHVVVVTPGGSQQQQQRSNSNTTKRNIKKETKSSLTGCTANLINAIVGSGIVGIPYAIRQAGFGAGIILIVLVAILTEKSLRLLIATAKHVHVPSYETVAEAAFGKVGFQFIATSMFIMAYGAMLSYLMIVKDSFSRLAGVDEFDYPSKRAILVAVSLTIMVPLSSQRDMANLAFTSRFSVVIDTVLVGLVAWNSPMKESLASVGGVSGLLRDQFVHWDTIFVGLGVLSFAFVCQHSAFIIAGSLERPTVCRWTRVTRTALSLCVVLALTSGITGYTGYLEHTQGNILQNLDADSVTANAARCMLGVTMLFVFPLECFVARHVTAVWLFRGRRAHEGDDSTILNRRDRRIGLTVLLYIAAVIPAAAFEDLGPVLALTGAVGGSSLAYIGPGFVYLGVHGGRFLELVQESWLGSKLTQQMSASATSTANGKASRAVETTPLVADQVEATQLSEQQQVAKKEKQEDHVHETLIESFLKNLVWYTSLMPVWCMIASYGRQGLTAHVYEMALKSPHPIRIGDVEYKRVRVLRGRVDADPEDGRAVLAPPGMLRNDSLPLLSAKDNDGVGGGGLQRTPNKLPVGSSNAGNINKMIGQNLLEHQKKQEQQSTPIEKDPQEVPPSWYDFGVAIFLVMFGVLAFVAGLISLSQE